MGASNFHKVNASKYFANTCAEEYEFEDLKSNIQTELSHSPYYYKNEIGKDRAELRSYPSFVLGTIISETKKYKDFDIEVALIAIVRSGYYDGCNLDWSVEFLINGDDMDQLNFAEMIEFQTNYSIANSKRYATFAEQWAKNKSEEMIEYIEKIYTQYSDQYQIEAQFSNGETFYSKIA